jgi:hypothetical protein
MLKVVHSIGDKKTYIIVIAILIAYIAYAASLFTWCRGYYTYEDMFGPLSKHVTIAISITLFLLASFLYFLSSKHGDGGRGSILPIIVLVLAITSIRLLPDVADSYYDQNFYDAGGHMTRGAFVTLTGHSNPNVDAYFDLQPAFSWFTAIFINIAYGTPSTPNDPIFGFFVKWFHAVAIIIYIPILFEFLRKCGLNYGETFLALFLFLVLSFSRFHYAAQTYANALFWLSIALLLDIIIYRDAKKAFMLMLVFTATIFIHEGVTIFMITTLISVTIALFLSKHTKKSLPTILMLSTYFLIPWSLYLLYISKFTLSKFADTVVSVIKRYLFEGVTGVVSQGTCRAWKPWEDVVIFKTVYMGMLILSGVVSTAWMYRATKSDAYLIRTFILLGVSIAIGTVAAGLGGAGYIERVPEMLLPLFSLTFVETHKQFNKCKYCNALKKTLTALMMLFIAMAPFVYFSGRNFQSIPTSEDKAGEFLITHMQSIVGLYPEIRTASAFTPLLTNPILTSSTIYGLYRHDFIQTLYYIIGDITALNNYIHKFESACNIMYSSSTTQLLHC